MLKKRRVAHSIEEKFAAVERWRKGPKMPMKQFALENGINVTNFSHWVKSMVESDKIGKKWLPKDNRKRMRDVEFPEVETALLKFIDLRQELYVTDKCGLSWEYIRSFCLTYVEKNLKDNPVYANFTASNGWINGVLKKNDYVGVVAHGEGNEISLQDAEAAMTSFRSNILAVAEQYSIPIQCVYNADQTGDEIIDFVMYIP